MVDVFTQVFVAALVLAIWSSLYKENPLYGYVTSSCMGIVLGYTLFVSVKTLWDKTLSPLIANPTITGMLVTLMGVIFLLRLVPRYEWLARYAIALSIGIQMAVTLRGALFAQFLAQIRIGSIISLDDPLTSFNNFILALCAFTTIVYFIFSREHKGVQGIISKIGRMALMISFGAMMATFYMGNVSFSIVQVADLATDYGRYVTLAAGILILADMVLHRTRTIKTEKIVTK